MASLNTLLAPPRPIDEDQARALATFDGDPELLMSLAAVPGGQALAGVLASVDPSGLNDVECLAYAAAAASRAGPTPC